jgi:hypothetical protein
VGGARDLLGRPAHGLDAAGEDLRAARPLALHRLTLVSASAQAKCGSSSAGEMPSTPYWHFQRSSTSGGVRCQKPLLISVLPPTQRPLDEAQRHLAHDGVMPLRR